MPFIKIGELFGNYVIVVDKADAVLLAFAYLLLLMAIPYLANIKQPRPKVSAAEPGMGTRAGTWEWNTIKWKYGRGRR